MLRGIGLTDRELQILGIKHAGNKEDSEMKKYLHERNFASTATCVKSIAKRHIQPPAMC